MSLLVGKLVLFFSTAAPYMKKKQVSTEYKQEKYYDVYVCFDGSARTWKNVTASVAVGSHHLLSSLEGGGDKRAEHSLETNHKIPLRTFQDHLHTPLSSTSNIPTKLRFPKL